MAQGRAFVQPGDQSRICRPSMERTRLRATYACAQMHKSCACCRLNWHLSRRMGSSHAIQFKQLISLKSGDHLAFCKHALQQTQKPSDIRRCAQSNHPILRRATEEAAGTVMKNTEPTLRETFARSRVSPWHLWMVRDHANLRGT